MSEADNVFLLVQNCDPNAKETEKGVALYIREGINSRSSLQVNGVP